MVELLLRLFATLSSLRCRGNDSYIRIGVGPFGKEYEMIARILSRWNHCAYQSSYWIRSVKSSADRSNIIFYVVKYEHSLQQSKSGMHVNSFLIMPRMASLSLPGNLPLSWFIYPAGGRSRIPYLDHGFRRGSAKHLSLVCLFWGSMMTVALDRIIYTKGVTSCEYCARCWRLHQNV